MAVTAQKGGGSQAWCLQKWTTNMSASMATTLCVAGHTEVVMKGFRGPFAALRALMEKGETVWTPLMESDGHFFVNRILETLSAED